MTFGHVVLVGTCCLLVSTDAAAGAQVAGPPVCLANERLQLLFDGNSGDLLRIRDVIAGHDHLGDHPSAASGFWSIQARLAGQGSASADGEPSQRIALTARTAHRFHHESRGAESSAIQLVWSDFRLPAAPDLAVEVEVRLDDRVPDSVWALTIRNPGPLVVEEVRFPVVFGVARQEDEVLAVPHWMGEKMSDARRFLTGGNTPRRLQWPYPGHLSLQCVAYYREGGSGLYLACRDATVQRKEFAVWGDSDARVSAEIAHFPEFRADGSGAWAGPTRAPDRLTLGYPVIVGTFCGDWFTVAERYREWGLRQAWARDSRLARGVVPDWVRQTAVWVWNRGRSPGVLEPAAALQQRLGLPVSVFWHWWHGCAYDAGFPEYLPPREGAEPFRAAVSEARQRDIHALVYMNQRLWGMTTASWTDEDAARFAVKGRNGEIAPEVYNTFTRQPCASMCMGTSFWRTKYAGLAEQAVHDLGVAGVYMDQACSSLPCYDPTHGHPLGAGNYWTEGFRVLADDIRRRCGVERPPALAGEGCGEPWLAHLDLMLTLQVSRERYAGIRDGWEVIPFFHAVYHPVAILFGNYSSLTIPPYDDLWPAEFAPTTPLTPLDQKFSGQYYLEQARAFVWGQQPTIANFLPSQFVERPKEIDYLLRLARIRQRAAPYLVHGTMLRAPKLDAPTVLLDFSRLSIYAGQRDRVQDFQKSSPSALAAAWRAPDGDIGIAVASTTDNPLTLTVELDDPPYNIGRHTSLYRIDESSRTAIGTIDARRPVLVLELEPLAACVIEIARE